MLKLFFFCLKEFKTAVGRARNLKGKINFTEELEVLAWYNQATIGIGINYIYFFSQIFVTFYKQSFIT